MKTRCFLLGLLLCITSGIHSQKQTIYVDNFYSEINVIAATVTQIRSAVIDEIGNTNRVRLVDALTVAPAEEVAPIEKALQYRAQYLLQGTILHREATDDGISSPRFHSRENSYKEAFTLRLQLIRTSDGTTIFSRNYEETGSSSGKDASQYNATENALLNTRYEVRTFIEQYFRVHGAIVNMASHNARKAKKVYINLGYEDPIKEGQRFDVTIEKSLPDGGTVPEKIGEVRISEIVGARYSVCKVMSKGADNILEAWDKGIKLHLVSREGRLFDDWRGPIQ